jgi:hypothetical protein
LFLRSYDKGIAAPLNFNFVAIELELSGNANGLAVPAHEEPSLL